MPRLEQLERRDCPAGGVVSGIFFDAPSGTLTLVGTNGDDVADVRNVAANTPTVQATLNGAVRFFDASRVTKIVLLGLNGDDDLSTFNTALPAVIDAGAGDDMVQAGGANDVVFTGKGRDTVYDILGTNVLASVDDGKEDLLFSNAASLVLSDGADRVVSFFAAGRAPGAGSVSLEAGVLYLTPPDGGSSTQLFRQGANVLLVTSWAGVQTFAARDVQFVAYFGGAGDDTFVNNTNVREVGYGGLGGNDTLTGGNSSFTFLKGGGGNDVLVGRAKVNDLAGQSGADVLVSLAGKSKLRTDALDTVFSRPNDRFLLP